MDFVEDLEGMETTPKADSCKNFTFLKNLGSSFNKVKWLELNYVNQFVELTRPWVTRAIAFAATKRSMFILWYLLRQYSTKKERGEVWKFIITFHLCWHVCLLLIIIRVYCLNKFK